ncbi:DUF4157 domain-containing protein [Nostoc sp. C110]|uniref:eCIS core domain-containing protein n=1 Tax=Nostoc sp. C110 TaxID=3349876 RepID=UPI00370DAF34
MHNKKLSKTPSSINTNPQAAEQNPKLTYRPFGSQVQKASVASVTETDIEDVAFAEQSIEATGLELQAKYAKITPEGQERLTVLQAKMDGLLNSRLEHATRFGHNFANIPLRKPNIAAPIQAKLTIGEPGDKYEQEADETARQVVQKIHQPQSEKLQRESLPEEEEELLDEEDELQMKPMVQRVSDDGMPATQDLETSINQARGGGQLLANNIREPMEQAFGADFSRVKVHTDSQADQLNQSIQAKAFTTGQDVFFRQGTYEPGSRGGQELLAHELTHVVQQNGHLSFPAPIQRQIEGYQPGTLKSNTKVMKDLNQQQKTKIQELHNDTSKTYTINEVRQLVGAAPLDTSTDTSYTPPFPFRYDPSGGTTMETVTSGMGGLVQYPKGGVSQGEDTNNQMSFSVGHGYNDLPSGSKRNITQTKVMDNISPNAAAHKLGFECPTPLSWEWLHLVAFSIGQTHVGDLSQKSKDLIQRTNQPQQISENLVLGTAAANTEMLSYETKIKRLLSKDQAWKLNLVVNARKQDFIVDGISIPVATRISYHFNFETGINTYTPPVIVEFNTQSHDKPATKSFEEVCKALDDTLKNTVALKEPLKGISTDAMDIV